MTTAALKMEIGQKFIPFQAFSGDYLSVLDNLIKREIITWSEKEMLRILNKFAYKDGECYPSQKRIETEIGLRNGQIRNLLRSLENKGFLEIHRPNPLQRHLFRQHNRYYFLWHNTYSEYTEKTAEIQTDTENDTQNAGQTDTGYNINPELSKSEKTATGVAVVSSVSDTDELPKEIIDLIPSDIPVTKGITRIIRAHLAKSGQETVERNIRYTCKNLRDKGKFRAYLDKCLRENWGIDFYAETEQKEQAIRQAEQKAVEADRQAKQAFIDGLNTAQKREELAQRFLTMPEDVRENVSQAYFLQCKAFIRKKARFLDHAGLADSLGFRLFLESSAMAV